MMKTNQVPTEAQEAKDLMQYMRDEGYKFTHIKNETGRSNASGHVKNWRAVWDKRDGVSKGFPDFAIVANNKLMFIELKRLKYSTTSQEQKDWIEAIKATGTPATIAKGAEEAIKFIEGVTNG
jgi:hypothetical protein